MSRFRKAAIFIIGLELLFIVVANLISINSSEYGDRLYRVEVHRIAEEMKECDNPEALNLSNCKYVVAITEYKPSQYCNNDYVVEEAAGKLYRIEYKVKSVKRPYYVLNIFLFLMLLISVGVLIYVDRHILAPFNKMQAMPAELAKGNLTMPLKQEKNKLFGGFIWGLDMLRENLEEKKSKELELHKEKKTLILSLSHDIKTPLSAIELYAKALESGLYESKEQQENALTGILKNVATIKDYVNQISEASREDFLNLEVKNGEFYLADAINKVESFYKDKLSALHIGFSVNPYENYLLMGDCDRVVEVFQNIVENAVKYGDGKDIRISFDEEEECRLVTISNSGNTMKQEEMPHIFESFYRGSNGNNIKGNGLGLYICKKLMKMMEGDVFASINGDRFEVTIVLRMA